MAKGFIYVLKAGQFYKIGRTANPEKRIHALAIQLPFRATVFLKREVYDYKHAESYLHGRFRAHRVNGEWFRLDPATASTIESELDFHCFMAEGEEEWVVEAE